MKRLIIPAICLLLALCSCTPKADKAAATASDFLTAFFEMDISHAAGLCSDDIAAVLLDTIPASDYPSEEIRAKVVEASKNTTFKILSSTELEETGGVEVKYEIHPYGAAGDAAIQRTMRLQLIDGDWKVVALE